MKFILLVFILLPSFLYSYYNSYNSYNNYLREKNAIKHKELMLKHHRLETERIQRETRRKKSERRSRNNEAKRANEKFYNKVKYENNNYNRNSYPRSTYRSPKKELNCNDFKNEPQLKLGNLHIFGITSVKPFKGNKIMIKAANGTFALPKDKYEKAEKINFNIEPTK
jgi:adenine specific DNA methylase Mod